MEDKAVDLLRLSMGGGDSSLSAMFIYSLLSGNNLSISSRLKLISSHVPHSFFDLLFERLPVFSCLYCGLLFILLDFPLGEFIRI